MKPSDVFESGSLTVEQAAELSKEAMEKDLVFSTKMEDVDLAEFHYVSEAPDAESLFQMFPVLDVMSTGQLLLKSNFGVTNEDMVVTNKVYVEAL